MPCRWCWTPGRSGEADSRRAIVEDLLDSAQDLVHVHAVLMDQAFDSQQILEAVDDRRLDYVVPKRMQASEQAQARRLMRRDEDSYTTERRLHLGNDEWHETTMVYERNPDSDRTDYRQYAVFMTNASAGVGAIHEYGYRWEIESGYKSIKRFVAATTSKHFGLRFFYFAFACLLYSIRRVIDLLVQVALTGEYERSAMVTAANTLVLLRTQIGIG